MHILLLVIYILHAIINYEVSLDAEFKCLQTSYL